MDALVARGGRVLEQDEFSSEWLLTAYFVGLVCVSLALPRAPNERPAAVCLAAFVAAHALAAWAAWTLGDRWCRRIIVVPGAPPVTSGPYRFLAHPIYVATTVEWLALPGLVGHLWYGVLAGAVVALHLRRRAALESTALSA